MGVNCHRGEFLQIVCVCREVSSSNKDQLQSLLVVIDSDTEISTVFIYPDEEESYFNRSCLSLRTTTVFPGSESFSSRHSCRVKRHVDEKCDPFFAKMHWMRPYRMVGPIRKETASRRLRFPQTVSPENKVFWSRYEKCGVWEGKRADSSARHIFTPLSCSSRIVVHICFGMCSPNRDATESMASVHSTVPVCFVCKWLKFWAVSVSCSVSDSCYDSESEQ